MSRIAGVTATAISLVACSVGPDYVKPIAAVPLRFKEVKGWKHATPRDAEPRGPWWLAFDDPTLDRLERQVEVSNQTVRAAEAAYRQSVAIVKEAQAALFPTVTGNYNAVRSHEGSAVSSSRGTTVGSGATTTAGSATTITGGGRAATFNTFTIEAGASWDLDVWGRIRRQIQSDVAAAQISDADLANARLLAQAQLATAYFDMRTQDALHDLLAATVADYRRTLQITQNQYAAGTAARSDVDNALAQLKTTEAQEVGTGVLRAQYEHAVAVLIDKLPSELNLRSAPLGSRFPMIPAGLPSRLLERRPDIAAAERAMQQQNELIGVAAAAFFPDISLSGSIGAVGSIALPLSAANTIWSLGGAVAQTLFDGGLKYADLAAATAGYDQSVAAYRQTVLTAFQQVEDALASSRILAEQAGIQNEAVTAARHAVDVTLNEYRAGTVAFTSVVTAQAMLLGDQETALTIRQNRYLANVNLIQAVGGGWTTADLAGQAKLKAAPTPAATSPDLSSDVFTTRLRL